MSGEGGERGSLLHLVISLICSDMESFGKLCSLDSSLKGVHLKNINLIIKIADLIVY